MREVLYDIHLLKAVLVLADVERIPTMNEFILSEFVNGLIDYLGRDHSVPILQYSIWPSYERQSYERKIIKYFDEQIAKAPRKLEQNIAAGVDRLTRVRQEYAAPERPYDMCRLYDLFKGPFGTGICEVDMRSTFSLPHNLVVRIQKQILPALSESEKKDILGISREMQKYICEDVEHIGRTYSW